MLSHFVSGFLKWHYAAALAAQFSCTGTGYAISTLFNPKNSQMASVTLTLIFSLVSGKHVYLRSAMCLPLITLPSCLDTIYHPSSCLPTSIPGPSHQLTFLLSYPHGCHIFPSLLPSLPPSLPIFLTLSNLSAHLPFSFARFVRSFVRSFVSSFLPHSLITSTHLL